MTTCPFCKARVDEKAVRCPSCSTTLPGTTAPAGLTPNSDEDDSAAEN